MFCFALVIMLGTYIYLLTHKVSLLLVSKGYTEEKIQLIMNALRYLLMNVFFVTYIY